MNRPQHGPLHWLQRVAERVTDTAVMLLVTLGALGWPEDRPHRHPQGGRR